jgi:Tol biopolymer transport system component/formylglycine-generating enzyme required for sulfatase activity
MTDPEQEFAHLQKLQAKHRKNIHKLKETLANYGMDRPLHLLNELEFEQEQLRRVEEQLAELAAQRGTEEVPTAPTESVRPQVPPRVTVPEPEMVLIPASEFLRGTRAEDADAITKEHPTERKRIRREVPQLPVFVEEFEIARYPVTNAEFRRFVEATGYRTQSEKDGYGWASIESKCEQVEGADWRHPQGPHSSIEGRMNHPVVQVSWRDAVMYCNWLSEKEGLTPCFREEDKLIQHDFSANGYRLPTEAEWEKAARGGVQIPNPQNPGELVDNPHPRRRYSWGDEFDTSKCNTAEGGLGSTSPVGQYFSDGDNPYGLADMAGNVWEWCTDWLQRYPGNSSHDDEYGETHRVLRGSSWKTGGLAHCAFRYARTPESREDDMGFRCAKSSPRGDYGAGPSQPAHIPSVHVMPSRPVPTPAEEPRQALKEKILAALRDPMWQMIGAVVAVISLGWAVYTFYTAGDDSGPTTPSPSPTQAATTVALIPTPTSSPTHTPVIFSAPPTSTPFPPTATSTLTPGPPTPTPVPPTDTPTPIPPTPTPTNTPVPLTTATTPDGGRIAFLSDRDGNSEIYVMDADGSGQTRLTNDPAADWFPSWSPDGTLIAFMPNRDGNWEIYAMNADGSGQTNLTNSPTWDGEPSWSPDGTRIAFKSDRGNDEVYVMNTDGSGLTPLTNNPAPDVLPSWSPDGTRIAFASYRDGNWEIYVMNADGSGQTNLTNNSASEWSCSRSPDGTRIAFMSKRDGNAEICMMNADGSGQTNLTNNPAADLWPSWSPDGTRIAFASDRDGNDEIYMMNADGSEQTNLTNNPASDSAPSWSPR